jgi:hypothetical protein
MNDQEAIIGLVADGRLPCCGAARDLHVSLAELVDLLNHHGIVSLRLTADELQRELEAAASRTRLTPVEK